MIGSFIYCLAIGFGVLAENWFDLLKKNTELYVITHLVLFVVIG